jgi:hypothetical protein
LSAFIVSFAGEVAREIDRLVVSGHDVATAFPDKPVVVRSLAAHPALLNTVAVVLLQRDLTRDDLHRIITYTPHQMVEALIDNNIAMDVLSEEDGLLSLTSAGRDVAAGVATVQDAAMAQLWAGADAAVRAVEEMTMPLVRRARDLEPAAALPTFPLFADVRDRATAAGRVLRLITAMRYWRADAHRQVLDDAGLTAAEAHALNRLWDMGRGVERAGQGFPEPGRKGTSALEARGLAAAGAISAAGIELRERIEHDTDERTGPLYAELDAGSRVRLLDALAALPA